MRLHGEGARLRALWRPFVINRYIQNTEIPRLHIGCGGSAASGWLNVDKFAREADTYLNAHERFPFKDNTFRLVFSEHTIEHLQIEKIHHFLSEIYRVMPPGGVCRITCPDLELYANSYVNNDAIFFEKINQGIAHIREKNPNVAWIVKTNGGAFISGIVKEFHRHRWMYDYETLDACLRAVGFRSTRKQSFQKSQEPLLAEMDNPDRAYETLYIEAVK